MTYLKPRIVDCHNLVAESGSIYPYYAERELTEAEESRRIPEVTWRHSHFVDGQPPHDELASRKARKDAITVAFSELAPRSDRVCFSGDSNEFDVK